MWLLPVVPVRVARHVGYQIQHSPGARFVSISGTRRYGAEAQSKGKKAKTKKGKSKPGGISKGRAKKR